MQQIKKNTEFEKRLNKFKGIKDKPVSIAQSIQMGLKQKVQAPIMNSRLAQSINLAFASKISTKEDNKLDSKSIINKLK